MLTVKPPAAIDAGQFKTLLQDLHKKEICIRVRLKGCPWMEHFATVVVFCADSLLLKHQHTGTVIHIPDITKVNEFQIDQSWGEFLPFHSYLVDSSRDEALADYGF